MPITSSAKKALRASKNKKVFNIRRESTMSNAVRNLKKLAKDGKAKEAKAMLPAVYKAIDKACKTKFLKKNTASRYKSRLTLLVNKIK